ncbi:YciE/YciF ferroxidase family protein [Natronococcus occultus]|uniref:Uncharacterized protein n=1 Tax=Natronococcus occultus SP4 TaxID=694430 RepID=L0K2A7_9EURY|nr:DUF892 family protein [Natronococcus occultus]AGB39427.1 hypothetical protein Natoc_3712 [Natronococcus occultus SP4]
MSIDTLEGLFVYKLRQQYYAERQLVETLDELATSATNGRLHRSFADHRDETRAQIERLEDVFATLGIDAETREAPILDAIDAQRRGFEAQIDDEDLLDLVYLTTGLMIERVEMSTYEGLSLLATELELGEEVHQPLEANYDEEQSAHGEIDTLAAASEMKSLWERLTPS